MRKLLLFCFMLLSKQTRSKQKAGQQKHLLGSEVLSDSVSHSVPRRQRKKISIENSMQTNSSRPKFHAQSMKRRLEIQ